MGQRKIVNETDINRILEERDSRYGGIIENATIGMDLVETMMATEGWKKLEPEMKYSMIMIAFKLSRVLAGDPNYDDNWKDISGYATLIWEILS